MVASSSNVWILCVGSILEMKEIDSLICLDEIDCTMRSDSLLNVMPNDGLCCDVIDFAVPCVVHSLEEVFDENIVKYQKQIFVEKAQTHIKINAVSNKIILK